MAYAKIMPDQKIVSPTEFMRQALAHLVSFRIHLRQLISDNPSAYRSRPVAALLRRPCGEHIFTHH